MGNILDHLTSPTPAWQPGDTEKLARSNPAELLRLVSAGEIPVTLSELNTVLTKVYGKDATKTLQSALLAKS